MILLILCQPVLVYRMLYGSLPKGWNRMLGNPIITSCIHKRCRRTCSQKCGQTGTKHTSKPKKTRQSGCFFTCLWSTSEEGIALMCLAEALLRIPDKVTQDRLISDKISTANWTRHLNKNNSLFVNLATLSLLMTGKMYSSFLKLNSRGHLVSKTSSALIRPLSCKEWNNWETIVMARQSMKH